jgi:hypothetical protein
MKVKINGMEMEVELEKCHVTEIKQAVECLINDSAVVSVSTVRGIVVERV